MINLNAKTSINPNEVIWVEGHINYSKIFTLNQKPIVIAITLKKVLEKFENYNFCRIHKRNIINLAYIEDFELKTDGLLYEGEYLPISRRLKNHVFERINEKKVSCKFN